MRRTCASPFARSTSPPGSPALTVGDARAIYAIVIAPRASLPMTQAKSVRSGSLLQSISADTLARRDLVPICVIRDTLLFLNGRCAALLGRPGDEFPKGLPLRDVVAEADWPRIARSLRRTTLKPGNGVSLIFSAVRKDGSILDLELTGTVVAGRGEIGVVAVANDVTQ